jgi:group I intron endonuclease
VRRIAPKTGVYCLTFPNGKRYVGVVTSARGSIARRWATYKRGQCAQQPRLYRALLKHGVTNVAFSVLVSGGAPDDLLAAEAKFISEFRTCDPQFGYNVSSGGASGRTGVPASPETKARLRALFLGRSPSPESREKNRLAHLGRTPSEESKAKRAVTVAAKKAAGWIPPSGWHHTPEAKAKISAAGTGRIKPPLKNPSEWRRKRAEAFAAKKAKGWCPPKTGPRSAEAREKMAAAKRGRKLSPEVRDRMSIAHREKFARRRAELGYAVSPETRARNRDAALRYIERTRGEETLAKNVGAA